MSTANIATLNDFINGHIGGGHYNRLGDCEIAVLLAWDMIKEDDWYIKSASKTGLIPEHAEHLRWAYENTTFLDLCLNQPINKKHYTEANLTLKTKY
jgi:hypothetical protein